LALEAQVVELRRTTVAKYIDAVEEVPEATILAKLRLLEAAVDSPLDAEAAAAPDAVRAAMPKVLRHFEAAYAQLKRSLGDARKQYSGAEVVAIDERSALVATIVVDYRAPPNTADVVVAAEACAARHVLEHVVLAQDAHVAGMRKDVDDLTSRIEIMQADVCDHLDDALEQIFKKVNACMDAQTAQIKELRAEVARLGKDINDRPLVVPLEDNATPYDCRLAGYSIESLLRAGFDMEVIIPAGFTAVELTKAGVPLVRLKGMFEEFEASDLHRAGVPFPEVRTLYKINCPEDAKKAGFTMLDLKGKDSGWTMQQFCNTGGLDGKPYSAREILDAMGQPPQHKHMSDVWGGNWGTNPI
jgi:hypothetical protein